MTYYLNPSFDKAIQAIRAVITNMSIRSSLTVANVTDGADGTYNYYLDMDTFQFSGLQFILSGGSGTVTVKVYGTIQDDGTAPGSCTYEDLTTGLTGSASFTSTTTILDDAGLLGLVKYAKIEVVASTGDSDDADWTIYAKRIK